MKTAEDCPLDARMVCASSLTKLVTLTTARWPGRHVRPRSASVTAKTRRTGGGRGCGQGTQQRGLTQREKMLVRPDQPRDERRADVTGVEDIVRPRGQSGGSGLEQGRSARLLRIAVRQEALVKKARRAVRRLVEIHHPDRRRLHFQRQPGGRARQFIRGQRHAQAARGRTSASSPAASPRGCARRTNP